MYVASFGNVNKIDECGSAALHYAVANKNKFRTEKLLSEGAEVNIREERFNRTPLHDAAFENVDESHLGVIEVLLRKGADVNARDCDGQTPLFNLVKDGSFKIVNLFLSYEADVKVVDKFNHSLLFPAAAGKENPEVLRLLMDLGLDANHRSVFGQTALHWACDLESENVEIIQCLLDNGADMNAIDRRKFTPLMEALYYRSTEGDEEITKKNLKFMLEHIDLNVMSSDVHVLTLDYESHEDYLWKMILDRLAQLSLIGPINAALLKTISENKEYEEYYEQRKKELLKTKRSQDTKTDFKYVTFSKSDTNIDYDDQSKDDVSLQPGISKVSKFVGWVKSKKPCGFRKKNDVSSQ